MRLAPVALLLAGCLGPELPLPRYPHAPHEWLCVNRVCPAVATARGGAVLGARYDARSRRCDCLTEDSRHLPDESHPDPHER